LLTVFASLLLAALLFAAGPTAAAEAQTVEGTIFLVTSSVNLTPGRAPDAPTHSLRLETDGTMITVVLDGDVIVVDESGATLRQNELRPGDAVRVLGTWSGPLRLIAARIERIESPLE